MDQLDLRLVRYFVAVARELHFGRAAERLHIAQPSLSQQIRRLESQLGVALLTRTSRRVELTTAGVTLLRDGEQLLQQAQRTVQTIRRTADETLAVGYFGTAASRLLPGTLAAFGERRPSTTVSVRELLFGDIDDIIAGNVDLAFTRLRTDQLAHLPVAVAELASEPRVLAVARSHTLAGRISISLRELGEDRFIVNPGTYDPNGLGRWKDEQRRHGLPGRIAGKARSVTELLTMVAAGTGDHARSRVRRSPAPPADDHLRPGDRCRAGRDLARLADRHALIWRAHIRRGSPGAGAAHPVRNGGRAARSPEAPGLRAQRTGRNRAKSLTARSGASRARPASTRWKPGRDLGPPESRGVIGNAAR